MDDEVVHTGNAPHHASSRYVDVEPVDMVTAGHDLFTMHGGVRKVVVPCQRGFFDGKHILSGREEPGIQGVRGRNTLPDTIDGVSPCLRIIQCVADVRSLGIPRIVQGEESVLCFRRVAILERIPHGRPKFSARKCLFTPRDLSDRARRQYEQTDHKPGDMSRRFSRVFHRCSIIRNAPLPGN